MPASAGGAHRGVFAGRHDRAGICAATPRSGPPAGAAQRGGGPHAPKSGSGFRRGSRSCANRASPRSPGPRKSVGSRPDFIARHPELVDRRMRQLQENHAPSYAAAYTVFSTSDLGDRLHAIRAPTLIATGEHDVGSNTRMAHFMHAADRGIAARDPSRPASQHPGRGAGAGDGAGARFSQRRTRDLGPQCGRPRDAAACDSVIVERRSGATRISHPSMPPERLATLRPRPAVSAGTPPAISSS